jgi:hypothetical protein
MGRVSFSHCTAQIAERIPNGSCCLGAQLCVLLRTLPKRPNLLCQFVSLNLQLRNSGGLFTPNVTIQPMLFNRNLEPRERCAKPGHRFVQFLHWDPASSAALGPLVTAQRL